MEIFSYFVHRFVFHGILWRIHETHHTPRKFPFELNDVFSLAFAAISMCLMIFAERPFSSSISFPTGFGIAVYGGFYFVIHDIFTHRRFVKFNSKNGLLSIIRRAHQRHHQTVEKKGIEPFGLFIFDYGKFGKRKENKKRKIQIADSVISE